MKARFYYCFLFLALPACISTPIDAPVIYTKGSPLIVNRSRSLDLQAPEYYRVKSGDTLYGITFTYGLDVTDVARLNRINAPFTIYPKQILRLLPYPPLLASDSTPKKKKPIVHGSKAKNKPKISQVAPESKSSAQSVKKQTEKSTVEGMKGSKSSDKGKGSTKYVGTYKKSTQSIGEKKSVTNWVWPVKGTIIKGFSNSKQGGKGLDIAGRLGMPIRAAGHGRVVYRGNGLRGYGQLIIIKHSDSLLSAYAHNSKILVAENEVVKPGQVIAEMGESGTDRVKLHFEIRRKGRPVDPLTFLPRI